MSGFPISYDAEAGILKLDGKGGVSVLLGILLKAKFADAFDAEVLFHPQLADLATELMRNGIIQGQQDAAPFSRGDLQVIAQLIVSESVRTDWWRKSREEQTEFVQTVVVGPHRLSPAQLEDLFDDIEHCLLWKKAVVEAATQAVSSDAPSG